MSKICFCVTIPATLGFSTATFPKYKDNGMELEILTSSPEESIKRTSQYGIGYKETDFQRSISPLKDLKCIRKLYGYFKKEKPEVVMAATPKAAMVGMITARLAGVKNRVYHIYGLPFETAKGLKLKMLLAIERLTGGCATHIVPIGTSVKDVTLGRKLYPASKMHQPSLLTVGGVDTDRFNPAKFTDVRDSLKKEIGIPKDKKVIGFVARLTYDKGFLDIIDVWNKIKSRGDVALLIVGDSDERVPIPQEKLNAFYSEESVYHIPFNNEVEKYFSLMDVFFFPSYREGFGNVSIEAAAMEIPVVSYDVTGCRDAVENNVTGFTVPFRDYDMALDKLNFFLDSEEERKSYGVRGRKRVLQHFTRERVATAFVNFISGLTSK